MQLLVTVVDYDRVGASEPIGQVLLGCDQKGAELKHWSEMLATPRRPVAQWHTLKPIRSKQQLEVAVALNALRDLECDPFWESEKRKLCAFL